MSDSACRPGATSASASGGVTDTISSKPSVLLASSVSNHSLDKLSPPPSGGTTDAFEQFGQKLLAAQQLLLEKIVVSAEERILGAIALIKEQIEEFSESTGRCQNQRSQRSSSACRMSNASDHVAPPLPTTTSHTDLQTTIDSHWSKSCEHVARPLQTMSSPYEPRTTSEGTKHAKNMKSCPVSTVSAVNGNRRTLDDEEAKVLTVRNLAACQANDIFQSKGLLTSGEMAAMKDKADQRRSSLMPTLALSSRAATSMSRGSVFSSILPRASVVAPVSPRHDGMAIVSEDSSKISQIPSKGCDQNAGDQSLSVASACSYADQALSGDSSSSPSPAFSERGPRANKSARRTWTSLVDSGRMTLGKKTSLTRKSMAVIRKTREQQLIKIADEHDSDTLNTDGDCINSQDVLPDASLPRMLMSGIGVLPPTHEGRGIWYYRLIQCFAVVSMVCSGVSSVIPAYSAYAHTATAPIAIGNLIGLLCLPRDGILSLLGPEARPLERYAYAHCFLDEWNAKSLRYAFYAIMAWLCIAVVRAVGPSARNDGGCSGEAESIGLVVFFNTTYLSGLFLALVYLQFHTLAFLELMLDFFCYEMYEQSDLHECLNQWNLLQAILRRAARAIETCFLSVETSTLLALVLRAVVLWEEYQSADPQCASHWVWVLLDQLPLGILAATALLLVFKAAAVTEKCAKVPSLVNSLPRTDPADAQRQYVVVHIVNSAAGFYVKDVRLTAFMALKITYLLGAVCFTLSLRVIDVL